MPAPTSPRNTTAANGTANAGSASPVQAGSSSPVLETADGSTPPVAPAQQENQETPQPDAVEEDDTNFLTQMGGAVVEETEREANRRFQNSESFGLTDAMMGTLNQEEQPGLLSRMFGSGQPQDVDYHHGPNDVNVIRARNGASYRTQSQRQLDRARAGAAAQDAALAASPIASLYAHEDNRADNLARFEQTVADRAAEAAATRVLEQQRRQHAAARAPLPEPIAALDAKLRRGVNLVRLRNEASRAAYERLEQALLDHQLDPALEGRTISDSGVARAAYDLAASDLPDDAVQTRQDAMAMLEAAATARDNDRIDQYIRRLRQQSFESGVAQGRRDEARNAGGARLSSGDINALNNLNRRRVAAGPASEHDRSWYDAEFRSQVPLADPNTAQVGSYDVKDRLAEARSSQDFNQALKYIAASCVFVVFLIGMICFCRPKSAKKAVKALLSSEPGSAASLKSQRSGIASYSSVPLNGDDSEDSEAEERRPLSGSARSVRSAKGSSVQVVSPRSVANTQEIV